MLLLFSSCVESPTQKEYFSVWFVDMVAEFFLTFPKFICKFIFNTTRLPAKHFDPWKFILSIHTYDRQSSSRMQSTFVHRHTSFQHKDSCRRPAFPSHISVSHQRFFPPSYILFFHTYSEYVTRRKSVLITKFPSQKFLSQRCSLQSLIILVQPPSLFLDNIVVITSE